MRAIHVLALLVSAALLPAAVPAHAQRVSLADRVAALEARSNDTSANAELLNHLAQLRSELAQQRGLVEQLQHELEKLKQSSREQYLDLDGRLNRLEGGTAPAAPGNAGPPVAPPAATRSTEPAPAIHGDAGALAKAGDERAAYDAAFDALRKGNYVDSAQLFQSFLQLYPSGVYAPNALYWLGESYYVTGNYPLAMQQFQGLIDRYPTHDKAAGALLKLGLSEYGMGRMDAAERTLDDVVSKYPGSDVARAADDRLKAIQLRRNLR